MIWHLARKHPFVVVAFALSLALTVFFAGKLAVQAIYWSNAAHHNQAIEGWMTAGYIARSWGVDARDLAVLAGLPLAQVKGYPQPLIEIARDRAVPVADVIAQAEGALKALLAKPAAAGQ